MSPFSTPDVVIGQGSLAVETLSQKSYFDNILIPLGGGGLLVGSATYFKYKNPKCKIHAIHPKVFNRKFNGDYYDSLSKPAYPTIADGLAVQHSRDDLISNLVEECTDEIDQV